MQKTLYQEGGGMEFKMSSSATSWKALAADTADALVEALHSPIAIKRNLAPRRVVVLVRSIQPLSGTPLPPLAGMPSRVRNTRVEFHQVVDDISGQGRHEIRIHLG